jgi:hypothetical protein
VAFVTRGSWDSPRGEPCDEAMPRPRFTDENEPRVLGELLFDTGDEADFSDGERFVISRHL